MCQLPSKNLKGELGVPNPPAPTNSSGSRSELRVAPLEADEDIAAWNTFVLELLLARAANGPHLSALKNIKYCTVLSVGDMIRLLYCWVFEFYIYYSCSRYLYIFSFVMPPVSARPLLEESAILPELKFSTLLLPPLRVGSIVYLGGNRSIF